MQWRLTEEKELELAWHLPLFGAVMLGFQISRWIFLWVTGFRLDNDFSFGPGATAGDWPGLLMDAFFGGLALWFGFSTRNAPARAGWWSFAAMRVLTHLTPIGASGQVMWLLREPIHAAMALLFVYAGRTELRRPRTLALAVAVSIATAGLGYSAGKAYYERFVPPSVMDGR